MLTKDFPPHGYILTESALEGIQVYMPAPPSDDPKHEAVVTFKCPNCGADRAFNAVDGGLRCASCGYHELPKVEVVGRAAQEFEFKVETLKSAGHGWGIERQELQCQDCGAVTTIPAESMSHTCPFCGSIKVIQQKAQQDLLRPRYLIPPKIDNQACNDCTRKWLGSSWMTPRALQQAAVLRDFSPLYLPFWTFDARTNATWRAEVGRTRTTGSGKNRRTTTVWRWESGTVNLFHDDILVSGTTHVSEVILKRVADFNTNDLVPYSPDFLAGIQAQSYERDLESAWKFGRDTMRETTKKACYGQASTQKIRNFSMTLDFSEEVWRYVLLPVYISNYVYEKEKYQLIVNAQTGTVSGQRPVSWPKVWIAIALILLPAVIGALIGAGAYIFDPDQLRGGLWEFGRTFGIFAFMLGAFCVQWAYRIFTEALSYGDA